MSDQSQKTIVGLDDSPVVTTRVEKSLDSLLTLCVRDDECTKSEINATHESSKYSEIDALASLLQEARKTIVAQKRQLLEMSQRSDALARAQAEAIVSSVEIIDELERTKHYLNEARNAAEEAAADTQRLADTIFERTNDGVLVLECRHSITCNDNALSLLDQSREQLIQSWPRAFDTAQSETADNLSHKFDELYNNAVNGFVGTVEAMLSRSSGETFWGEVTMSSFCVKDGGHVLAVIRDVSSRKRFEAELRRHRDFLDNIINAVPDPLSVKRLDQTLVIANDAFCRAAGVNRNEVIGRTAVGLIAFDDVSEIGEILNSQRSSSLSGSFERRYRDSIGVERVSSIKTSVFSDRESAEHYTVSTSRDITEARNREQQLQLLASVFRSASEGIAILTSGGFIVEANPAFAKMAGVEDASRLVGQSLDVVLASPIEHYSEVISKVASGLPWSGKSAVMQADAVVSSYWVSLSCSLQAEDQTRIIALVSDITQLDSSQAELKRRALCDPLTRLSNRAHFREYLRDSIAVPGSTGTICFLDLDDFKHVNDSAGHKAGDDLLCQVADRLLAGLPPNAFLSRFGGDEFAVILSEQCCPTARVSDAMDELLLLFREPFVLEQSQATVGLSIGICHYSDVSRDVETLMQSADIAMYVAKTAGKNCVRTFTREMQESVDLRHRVKSRLQNALSNGELTLHYQAKVDGKTTRTVSCEALVRWRAEDGNYVTPSEFIPIAEQTGLIGPLGDLVFEMAVKQACKWAATGVQPSIAVNISPHQIRDPHFIQRCVRTLSENQALGEWFELEITEHAMMDDVHHAVAVVRELSSLGFRIAIDDFGTGYSSLSYLKHFDIDTLKIDISFVRDVVDDAHSQAIVQSIISLGHGLGLIVVAEGVEEPRQAQILSDFGCDILQGHLFGRPVPADQFEFGSVLGSGL